MDSSKKTRFFTRFRPMDSVVEKSSTFIRLLGALATGI
jgi:hypothetical protein